MHTYSFRQHLPETVQAANKFGKGVKFWSYLPQPQNLDNEDSSNSNSTHNNNKDKNKGHK